MVIQSDPVDVLIVGAGPAGLTAAIYSGRALLSTVVLEKGLPGGQLNETDLIENWPGFAEAISAPELMKRMTSSALSPVQQSTRSSQLKDPTKPEPSSLLLVQDQGSFQLKMPKD